MSVCRVARGVLKRDPSVLKNSISKTGHQRARRRGGWLRAAALTAGVAFASTAHAGVDAGSTIPGTQSGSVSVVAPTRTATLRTTTTKVHWISHQDCVDDIQITFTPVVSAPSTSKVMSAFVSNSVDDCLQNATRNDLTRCKHLPVTSGTESMGSPNITFKASKLAELMGITKCGDEVADGATSTATAPRSLKFYFMLSPPQQDLIQGTDNFAIFADSGIDLWGPPAPSGLTVESGDEALAIKFIDGSNDDSDRLGYHVYVDDGTLTVDGGTALPSSTTSAAAGSGTSTSVTSSTSASGSGGAGGAGGAGGSGGATSSASSSTASSSASSASSTSASGTTSAGSTTAGSGATTGTTTGSAMSTGVTSGGNTDACNASTAVATCVPASAALVAGEIPAAGTTINIDTGNTGAVGNLQNGKAYVIALAAYDDVGNIGKLSEPKCGTPAPVDSILRVYRCKGGFTESGCGLCSVGGDRGGSFAALVSAGLVVAGFAARRTRRPRAVRASRGAR